MLPSAAAAAVVAYDQGPLLWISGHDCTFMSIGLIQGFLVLYIGISLTMSFTSEVMKMYLAVAWAQDIFILTMQAILIIRIYALFNQSKMLLIFLVTLYSLQTIAVLVMGGLSMTKQVLHKYFVSVSPVIGSVGQSVDLNASAFLLFYRDISILNVAFDTVLLFFALWAFVRHALEAKRLDGGWSINGLVRAMMANHLLYFVCYSVWLSLGLVTSYFTTLGDDSGALVDNLLDVLNALVVVAGPRMVISLRAQESKTRGEEGTSNGELSTIRFDTRELPTKSESAVENGGGL
ncbi:hypothetical protein BJ138DRAFT_1103925 [Hygrophoropsis aurantiaca]|uniref:Uncharacterized protein n=1 Tax=Hygrophoropsis aurantiaca TaxID=72124 RepID=A0ACB8A3V4_9AGAM|nr:hypothetical protein BJ138DRAFT_1103925 [Hygrophoropsis aurantiaca]